MIEQPFAHMPIHDEPCPKCPTAHYPPDPESADIEAWVKAGKQPAGAWVFPCAWRREKLCKGICDYLGFTEKA